MARKQAKSHRFFGSRTSRSVTSDLPSGGSQGSFKASVDVPSITMPANPDRKLLSMIFHRSNNTSSSDPLATETTDNSIGSQVNAAQQAMDGMKSIPQALQTTIGLVGEADAAVMSIQNITAILRPLKLFNSFVTNLSNVHPYVQFALGILTAASQLLIDQANLESAVFGLLNTVKDVYEFLMEKDTLENIDSMKETLRKISQEMSATALFVIKYCKKTELFGTNRGPRRFRPADRRPWPRQRIWAT
ncbi:hypothetical protein PISMIDRAFT_267739 [Pisolithus microcarpus 441]|uniref:Uncharacterized protein n=1 Tax=Pisolithus microcarpus 441 TaxID=765257 RepID=A0A0C9Z918_9AGAM|nr:hypothetical protein PISMIDRAFT_267739 [Pisolithus microcarpus 441]